MSTLTLSFGFLAKNPNLGSAARRALTDPDSELILPAIALAEALWILSSRRLGVEPSSLIGAINAHPRITVYPLTQAIVETAQAIATVAEMHDRQIVATALFLSTPLDEVVVLTRDENIVNSGAVSVSW